MLKTKEKVTSKVPLERQLEQQPSGLLWKSVSPRTVLTTELG